MHKKVIIIALDDYYKRAFYRRTGGGPPPKPLTQEEEKVISISGSENPILTGELTGFDSLISPDEALQELNRNATMEDLETELADSQFEEAPAMERPVSCPSIVNESKFRKRKVMQNFSLKEELTCDVLVLEKEKLKIEIEYYKTKIEAAKSKKAYYESANLKQQLEASLLIRNNEGLQPVVIQYAGSPEL